MRRDPTCVVVLAGGDPVDPALRARLPRAGAVIAADSGVHHAEALGLTVDVIVGDFDSADPALVEATIAAGARTERHPPDKDLTDLELALDAADRMGARDVLVVGGDGGRLDHLLGNALLLASPRFTHLRIQALMGSARVTVVRDRAVLRGEPGSLVTLLAAFGAARGVTTSGLRYPLAGDDLHPGSTRGVSNELVEPAARVCVGAGVLLAVQPFDGEDGR